MYSRARPRSCSDSRVYSVMYSMLRLHIRRIEPYSLDLKLLFLEFRQKYTQNFAFTDSHSTRNPVASCAASDVKSISTELVVESGTLGVSFVLVILEQVQLHSSTKNNKVPCHSSYQ